MKLVTFYIPQHEQERFHDFLAERKIIFGNGENISAKENDFIYIDNFTDSLNELERQEITELESILGNFSVFTIHWRDNSNFYSLLQELNNDFLYVVDNDHWQTKTAKEISNLPFEEFDKWILGKN